MQKSDKLAKNRYIKTDFRHRLTAFVTKEQERKLHRIALARKCSVSMAICSLIDAIEVKHDEPAITP